MKESFKIYGRLLGYMWVYWLAFLIGILGTVVSSGTDAGFAWFLKPLLDKGFINRDMHFIHWLPYIIVIAMVVRGIGGFLSDYYITLVGRNVVLTFRQQLFKHALSLPAKYLDNLNKGRLLSVLIYNVEQVTRASTTALITVVREVVTVGGLITVMFLNSWQLSLIFIISIPFIAITIKLTSKRMRRLSHNLQDCMGSVTSIAQEGFENYRVVKGFNSYDHETKRFDKVTRLNRSQDLKTTVADSIGTSVVQIIASIVLGFTVYLATSPTHFGISAGAFVSMVAAMLALLKPMKNLTTINSVIQKGIAGAESLFEVLDEETEPDLGTRGIERAKGKVTIKNLSFTYPDHDPVVLKNINIDVAPGQTIALVGRSGSGKSTLITLLQRFYDYKEGLMAVDDIDIRELKLNSLRDQISVVSQSISLFDDTVAHNVAYGHLDASKEEIIDAMKQAHAWEFVKDMPDQIETLIGQNGVKLSGGQRQRIAIARALLKDSPILILDEATASLDTESERLIQEALETLMKKRTTIVIAHRLSTIEKADNIIVMDKGRIIETGQHQELLSKGGIYSNLYKMQFNDE